MTNTKSRILLLGATGKTGQLILEQLIAKQARPVLVGRNPETLKALAERYGNLDIAIADAQDPDSLRAIIRAGDVLVSTVGPFETLGKIPLAVAVEQGAHYLDTSGEPDFTDYVYETYEQQLEGSSQVIITSCGFDFVPGQVVAGELLAQYGEKVDTLNVIYSTADGRFANLTTGTLNTFAKAITEQGTFYNNGEFYKGYFGAKSYPIRGSAVILEKFAKVSLTFCFLLKISKIRF
ncbi:saccharopine dehydrogenase NADP-binding domain-containing protein [Spongiibacter sp. KMU-158]|uniref:Saccharopine dehydrogenase NADP-binding domain-containing protein n=1 Tax=Spongiibacter pelagi TaxID=2760804 RepID=A0A927C4G9_9GAMM|nr:saccharopine dehydrogenase NADP-binding domain-containing protein [Spongiibacter pelagi]MBD2859270.1 saccharopine dehydrogenase NADP-binding domain-containing protein [Spongiibacter pelagi]